MLRVEVRRGISATVQSVGRALSGCAGPGPECQAEGLGTVGCGATEATSEGAARKMTLRIR